MEQQVSKGQRVEILRVRNPEINNRASYVGQRGVVRKVVKSRGVVQIALDDGRSWEASKENVAVLAH